MEQIYEIIMWFFSKMENANGYFQKIEKILKMPSGPHTQDPEFSKTVSIHWYSINLITPSQKELISIDLREKNNEIPNTLAIFTILTLTLVTN